MKEETTILLEKKEIKLVKETKPKTKQEVKQETKTITEKKEEKIVKKLFEEEVNDEVVVEKPNFDQLKELPPEKRKKVFKLEKEKVTEKKKNSFKLKLILASICLVILAAFCITTGVEIAKANQSLNAVQSEYSANVATLIQKIYSTETGNRSLSLFETFPEEDLTASSFYETSNWFDRFCKFLTGLFGG